MFCPNCGTENDDKAGSCKKCGFNLKGAAAPKFKGTMLMVNAPPNVPRPGVAPGLTPGPGPIRHRLKGTMLGVAPPSPGGIAPPPPPPEAHQAPAMAPPPAPLQQHASEGGTLPLPTTGDPAAVQSPAVNPLGGTMLASEGANVAFGSANQVPGQAAQPAPYQVPGQGGPGAFPGPGAPPAEQGWGYPGQPGFAPEQAGYGAVPGQAPQGYAPPGGAVPAGQAPQGYAPPGGAAPYGQAPQGYAPAPGAPMMSYGQPGGAMVANPAAPIAVGFHGPIGKVRSPVLVLLLGAVTCGVYWFFWGYQSLSELRAFRQRDDINPIFFFIPILSLIEIWNLPPKMLESKQMAGIENAQVYHPIFYLLLGQYFLTEDLNEVFEAARARQQQSF